MRSLNFPLQNLYKIDGTKSSCHSNAFFTGIFNKMKIILFDSIIEQLDVEEIEAIICKELGHWHYMHLTFMITL